MATQTSNIDDILLGHKTPLQPHTPESDAISDVDYDNEVPRETLTDSQSGLQNEDNPLSDTEYGLDEPKEEKKVEVQTDDYGNQKSAPKTYTEDEVNERINSAVRERLARAERNSSQPTQQQVQQQAQQGFEYNAESNESWQQQLESFVEQTVSRMGQKQAQQAYQQRERDITTEFESRFQLGMSKFNDYKDVVGSQPITDAMLMAARSTKDPAAFIYAASKRAPQELKDISQMSDPYAQVAAMGRLEERLKQSKSGTKAPKPISRTQEDSSIPHKSDKQPSIEQLIAMDAAKRLEKQKQRKR